MLTINQKIAAAHFVATEQQVELLAMTRVEGITSDSTYLRVLVVAVQAAVGTKRTRKVVAGEQLSVIDQVHERFYPHVMKGVAPAGVDDKERARLSNFARTAASTLRAYVRGGGDIRALVPPDVTKAKLRAAAAPPTPTGSRAERAFLTAQGALLRTASRIARADPEGARERLETALEAINELLDELPEGPDIGGTTTTIGTHIGGRAGSGRAMPANAQLHKGA